MPRQWNHRRGTVIFRSTLTVDGQHTDIRLMDIELAWNQLTEDVYRWSWYWTDPVLTSDDITDLLTGGVPGVHEHDVLVECASHPNIPLSWVSRMLFGENGMDALPVRVQEQLLTALAGNRELPAEVIRAVWVASSREEGWDLSSSLISNPSTPSDVLSDITRQTVHSGCWVYSRDLDRIAHLIRNPNLGEDSGKELLATVHSVLTGQINTELDEVIGEMPSVIRWHLTHLMLSVYNDPHRSSWVSPEQESWLLVAVASA